MMFEKKSEARFFSNKEHVLNKPNRLLVLLLITALSESVGNTLAVKDSCLPDQVHLSFGDSSAEVVVVWETSDVCSSTTVLYGTLPWRLEDTAVGTSIKFSESNSTHNLHRVRLKKLQGSVTYFYQPQSDSVSAGPFYFKTPPSDHDWSPVFLILGDIQPNSPSIPPLTSQIMTGRYTAVLHVGDLVHNASSDSGKAEDDFMRLTEVLASHVPFMITAGEYDTEAHRQARYHYSMPGTNWPTPTDKMWYSIDIGPVHLISYSTEVFFTSDQKYARSQRDWLMSDLKQANDRRDTQPWVIAIGHRPMYCQNSSLFDRDCMREDSKVRQGFEDLFFDYGVDVVLQSYDVYERLWPQYKGVVLSNNYTQPAAPVHVVLGTLDAIHNDNGVVHNQTDNSNPLIAFRPNTSLSCYGYLHVVNSSHAYWQMKSTFSSDVMDSVWIVQNHHGPFKTENLPKNISIEIKESMNKNGGKPSYLDNTVSKTTAMFSSDRTRHIAIGVVCGIFFIVIIITVLAIKKCRRSRPVARRWEQLDFNYGKKLYAPSKDLDKELDNDFEIDMNDGTTKLLSEN